MSRVFKSKDNQITQEYKAGNHNGIDLVGYKSQLDYIVAHSDGTVVEYRTNYATNDKSGNSYGNYVKIKHDGDYYTLYAHMQYKSVAVKTGDKVKKGQIIGYMGNTGYSFGAHLHFEVWKGNNRINPKPYINADLPAATPTATPTATLKYKVGDIVTINGVYVSSTSDKKYKPAKTKGKITKIIEGARNPYLLENGNIGWTNDSCIVSSTTKSIDTVAKEVIAGKWGNGADRKKRLEKAGYNYREVQNRVNQLLK